MDDVTQRKLERFFVEYARAASSFDSDAIARSYTETYIEAGPAGSIALHVDESYRAALDQHRELLTHQLGFRSAEVLSVEATDVAPAHATVLVRWRMRFVPPGKDEAVAEFDQTYVVRCDDEPRILLYISHEDQQEKMRALDLLPQ